MAGRTMNNPRLAAWAALLIAASPLLLTGCGSAPETPPLAGAKIGGPFALTDQDGRKVRDSDFAGKYRLIYFGYTFCPDVCPVDVQTLMKGYRELEKTNPSLASRIQPIFITVDPVRDTPDKLKQFVRAFHPKLIGLTGTESEIAGVAKEYAVFYEKMPAEKDGSYLVNHVRAAYLMGPAGEPIALITQDKGADTVVSDIERWAR